MDYLELVELDYEVKGHAISLQEGWNLYEIWLSVEDSGFLEFIVSISV